MGRYLIERHPENRFVRVWFYADRRDMKDWLETWHNGLNDIHKRVYGVPLVVEDLAPTKWPKSDLAHELAQALGERGGVFGWLRVEDSMKQELLRTGFWKPESSAS